LFSPEFILRIGVVLLGVPVGMIIQGFVLMAIKNGEWKKMSNRLRWGIVLRGGAVAFVTGLVVMRLDVDKALEIATWDVWQAQALAATSSGIVLEMWQRRIKGE
jgi:hypothetical protein